MKVYHKKFRVFESRVAFDAAPPRFLGYSVGSLCSMAASDTETWWHMSRISFSSLSSNPTLRRPKTRRHHSVRRARATSLDAPGHLRRDPPLFPVRIVVVGSQPPSAESSASMPAGLGTYGPLAVCR